jgi:hypothetical protein
VGKFRKILKKADDLLPAGSEQRWQDSIEEEAKGAGANVTLSSGTGASLLGRHHDAPEADDRPMSGIPRCHGADGKMLGPDPGRAQPFSLTRARP